MMQRVCEVELQRRADNAGTIFLVGADFWERPKNRAMMSLGLFLSILYFKFWRNSCLQTLITLSIFTPNINNPNTKHSGNRA